MISTPMAGHVGVLGGTFDPIHIGHLILAEEARDQLDLSIVYFVPAGNPPHKRERRSGPGGRPSADDRAGACGQSTRFRVSRWMPTAPARTTPLTWCTSFRVNFRPAARLYFLMGFDSLADLPELARAGEAHGGLPPGGADPLQRADRIGATWKRLCPASSERVTLLDMPELEIASHQIQDACAQAAASATWCRTPVCEYIREQGLYNG